MRIHSSVFRMKKDRNGVYEAAFSLGHFRNYFSLKPQNIGISPSIKFLVLKNSIPQKIPYLGKFINFSKTFFQIMKTVFNHADFKPWNKPFLSAHIFESACGVNFYTCWKNGSIHPDKAQNRGVFWCRHRYNRDGRDR